MQPRHETTTLDVLDNLLTTDRQFYTTLRFFSPTSRETLTAAHMRTRAQLLGILRTNMVVTQPVVVSVPLTMRGPGENFWETVSVAPTAAQILTGTERDVEPPAETSCAICQDTLTGTGTRLRRCQHVFHDACIQTWFNLNPRCPICRSDIRETTHSLSNERSSMHSHDEPAMGV